MELVLHFDGGSRGNPGPAAAGVTIDDSDGTALFEAGYYLGRMTNNSAEYQGLIHVLEAASAWPEASLLIVCDSELVVRQITGEYRVKSPDLQPLFQKAQRLLLQRDQWRIKHVPRAQNSRADGLANRAMDDHADVIVLDCRPGTPTGGKRNGTAKTSRAEVGDHVVAKTATRPSATDGDSSIIATCVTPGKKGVCPAPCERGSRHAFGRTAPAELCLESVASMITTVLAVRDAGLTPGDDAPPLQIRCSKANCGAMFELTCELDEVE